MKNAKMIEATAAAWFARRDSGMWNEDDQVEFDTWLNCSVAHRIAFIRVETVWKQTQRLKALRANSQPGEVPPVGEWQFSPFFEAKAIRADGPSHRWRGQKGLSSWARGVAAGIVFAAAVATTWYVTSNRLPSYRTALGGMATVPLSDGSTVTLNTNSEIRVALTPAARTITLNGEAFFEVAKDPGRPFIVDVGSARVTAVGTKFSVRRDGQRVRVVVMEGHVRVEAKDAPSQPPATLEPGDVGDADRDGVLVLQKPVAQVEADYLSWRKGYITFRDTPLGEVIKELNRYNVHKIRVSSPAVAAIRIGGEFRVTNVDAFLRLIQQGLPVRAIKQDDEIVLEQD
jgi:transmembrane sensor